MFSRLENQEICSKASEKEELNQLFNSNLQPKKTGEEKNDYFEETVFSNAFLAARSY